MSRIDRPSSGGGHHVVLAMPDLRGSISLWVIIICLSVYATQAVLNLLNILSYNATFSSLGLSRALLWRGWVWQPFTAPFVHFGIPHLFFNMLTLAFFGADIEKRLGWKHYVLFSLVCAMASSVGFLALAEPMTVGAGYSGVIFGILAACAVLYPDRVIQMFWFFPIKMKWAMLILGGMAFFATIGPGEDGIAHSAHLFGGMAGYVYIKAWERGVGKTAESPRRALPFVGQKKQTKKKVARKRLPNKL